MDWSAFVGLPWADRGRGPATYDCWGLLRAAFAAGTGIDLPGHEDGYAGASDRDEIARIVAGGLGDWMPVTPGTETAFDGAMMRLRGELHVGLVVRRGRLLHARRGRLSSIEPLSRFAGVELYRHRLVGQS